MRTKKTTGSTITEYYQDVAGGLPRVAADKTDTVWNYYVYGNSLIGKVGSDNVARYYHYDGTGHVRAITDSTGTVVERYDYDAFGALRNTPTGLSNDRRFTGEQYDAETAYTFLRARYYDPALGRFISKDSFKGVKNDPQSLNRFIYVGNNPVNKVDRSGQRAANPDDGLAARTKDPLPDPEPIESQEESDASSDPLPEYIDLNIGYAEGLIPGPTAGYYYTHDDGGYTLTHGYVGGMLGTPSASIMGSGSEVSTGWNIQVQGSWPDKGAHALGVSLEPCCSIFSEHGVGTPGGSVSIYYVYELQR